MNWLIDLVFSAEVRELFADTIFIPADAEIVDSVDYFRYLVQLAAGAAGAVDSDPKAIESLGQPAS
jgi:hypothetical protein